MKSLLLAAVAALTLTVTAQAAQQLVEDLPNSMMGSWCYLKEHGRISVFQRKDCHDSDGWLDVTGFRFDGHELICNVNKILRLARGKTYRLEMKCAGEGVLWSERTIVHIKGEHLWVRTEWKSKERVEESRNSED
jgi:hypothetical protein